VNLAQIRKIAAFGRIELVIYFATLIGIVLVDLLTGVLIGFGIAVAKLVWSLTHVRIDRMEDAATGRIDFDLHGSATFVSIPRIAAALDTVPTGSEVHIQIKHLDHIDHACLDMLSAWGRQHEATGGKLVLEWHELQTRYAAPQSAQDQAARRKKAEAVA
jgi:MFS superfamily sulfate permease-like transporter